MSTTIRGAAASDLEAIYDLARRLAVFEHLEDQFVATPESYAEGIFGEDAPASVLIAEIDGQVAGYALYFHTFSTFLGRAGIWLEDLFVDEAFRRRGVARALLVGLQERTEGRLEWEVLDWNGGAIALYESLGATRFTGWTKYRVSPGG